MTETGGADLERGRAGDPAALSGSAFLAGIPLPRQRALLERLVAAAAADRRFRFVELGCSVARGAGDELSDLDVALGVADDAWPSALADLEALARSLGDAVDVLEHSIPEWGERRHRRLFAQYRDGTQLDLVAMPASSRTGLPPESVALYDADGRLGARVTPSAHAASPGDLREWTFLAFAALADLDKYLRRGSTWEAFERLHAARAFLWRLWAVSRGLPYPAFGLTTVLDATPVQLPPGIETTVATLDPADLRRAAIELAGLLIETSRSVPGAAQEIAGGDGIAAFVLERLRSDG